MKIDEKISVFLERRSGDFTKKLTKHTQKIFFEKIKKKKGLPQNKIKEND